MKSAVLCLSLAACTFAGAPAGTGDDTPIAPGVDAMAPSSVDAAGPMVAPPCDGADVDVRFCMDFEAPEAFRNKAPYSLSIQTQNVQLQRETQGQVARMDDNSQITIGESPTLDVDQLTMTMWIQPHVAEREQFLLDNHLQYATVYEDDGDIRCMIGSAAARSSDDVPVSTSAWTHVACTYDRSQIRVYVNGSLEGCTPYDRATPKDGTQGVAIGGNKESFGVIDEFVGGLDLVRVHSRVLSAVEICTAAGQTDCKTDCPD